MIHMQRAQLSFQMLVEIRNKSPLRSYQELSRMQISKVTTDGNRFPSRTVLLKNFAGAPESCPAHHVRPDDWSDCTVCRRLIRGGTLQPDYPFSMVYLQPEVANEIVTNWEI